MFSSLSNSKVFPTSINNTDDTTTTVKSIVKQTNNNTQSSQDNIQLTNDPYSLPINIKSAFTLSIKDVYCPYYAKGYNLLHDSRTSK